MIFGTMDRMGSTMIEQTAEIAGRIVSSGTTAAFAAKEARKVMAELLGLKSLSFELTQTNGEVNGIEISFELKEDRPGTTCGTPLSALSKDFNRDATRRMANAADGELKRNDPEFDAAARKAIDASAARAPTMESK